MRHASLFSGIGGFDLAAEWMGWTNVFTCEIDSFPRQVLKHHFPNATHYEDIKQTDFSVHRGEIDILTGGFPCQPFSTAGKRLGKEDERHLWPEMLRAIREIEPKYIVGENVRGILNWSDGLVVDEVFSDLEAEGYEVLAFVLPAAGINAPHRRDRVWFIAYSDSNRRANGDNRSSKEKSRERAKFINNNKDGGMEFTAYSSIKRQQGQGEQSIGGQERFIERGVLQRNLADTTSDRRSRQGQGIEAQEGHEARSESAGIMEGGSQGLRQQRDASNAYGAGVQGLATDTRAGESIGQGWQGSQEAWHDGRFATWEDFPTQSPICGGDDGLSLGLDGITFPKWRNQSIKAYGNAIVPQIAYRIFKAIELTNQKMEK